MDNEKIVTYQDLENIYVLCMREVIKAATEHAWGDTELGAYGTFKMYDEANVAEVNAIREAKGEKKIVPITINNKPFDKFDFQACNNTFAHLEPVYKEIYDFYDITAQNALNCTMFSKQLVDLRNKLAHPDPNQPAEQVIEWQKTSANYMNVIFGLGFSGVADKNGVTYNEMFQKLYVEYISRQLESWYYLADFLDIEKYDTSRFLEVCAVNGIKATIKEGKYLFCTSNLEKTIAILKNNLAFDAEVNDKKDKKKVKLAYIIPIAIAILLALAIGFGSLITSLGKPNENNEESGNVGSVQQVEQNQQSAPNLNEQNQEQQTPSQNEKPTENETQNEQPKDETVKDANSSTNQIPEHLEGQVTGLKYADKLSLLNKTIYVGVGEYATLSAAQMWQNVGPVTIYSEDTSIAVGESPLVKGVSKGTTFVVVESSLGSASSYCVVVE